MTQYNSLNVKLNKLQSAIKNETEVILRLSSNMIGNSNDETNFPHIFLLLTNTQVANLCKAFANYLSIDLKLSKTQLSKIIQSGGFLGLPLMKSVIQLLAKSVLMPLGITAAAAAAAPNRGMHKKILGSGTASLIISYAEMEDISKITKSLEDSGLLLKGVSETNQIEAKEQKGEFLSIIRYIRCKFIRKYVSR